MTGPVDELDRLVERMAVREAEAHFLTPAEQHPGVVRPPAPPVAVLIEPCLVCERTTTAALPFAHWDTDDPSLPTLTMLACEWLTPRAVLPLAVAVERFGALATGFRTRAAARADLWQLAEAEAWADVVVAGGDAAAFAAARTSVGLVLPAATRGAGSLTPLFRGPHTPQDRLNDLYLRTRLRWADVALGGVPVCQI
jgi:hypothetical protein